MALTEAARLFLQEEKETHRLQCPGFEEHLQAAINCYSFAIKVDISCFSGSECSSLFSPTIQFLLVFYICIISHSSLRKPNA